MELKTLALTIVLSIFVGRGAFAACSEDDEPLVDVIAHNPLRYFNAEWRNGYVEFSCVLPVDAGDEDVGDESEYLKRECSRFINGHLWYEGGCKGNVKSLGDVSGFEVVERDKSLRSDLPGVRELWIVKKVKTDI